MKEKQLGVPILGLVGIFCASRHIYFTSSQTLVLQTVVGVAPEDTTTKLRLSSFPRWLCNRSPICPTTHRNTGIDEYGNKGSPVPRFTDNKDCQRSYKAYMCYLNFPR